ncbi:ribosomal protein S18-alanine N-acetyltransferase [Alkalicoccus urumqiensis]|uniref:[Ribosomal protein bS18]-alanine N-acetyltransferase n=1 Tax=Alkalicoccus urumqiensis TaxID=1548213 RepID=A0A2P6MJA4_ALKUR|nr:ribosomal protein S18-alanine N-acetyltransferase [Alkalicoccus urumqiensis]PRO66366.1 ribosomal-protein-alanine N-acetyltransferase [Alkalicoccus urumqiensis]
MESNHSIRLMGVTDIPAVLDVEIESFATPWTQEAFYQEVAKNKFAYYFVAEEAEQILGYCGLWVIVDDAHITNIAVLPGRRREGIGDSLLLASMNMAKMLGAQRLSLEVRVSNEAAQNLYRRHGFQDGGLRRRYYTDNQEDALVMWVNLS